jgi:hypothetical protein
MFEALREAGDTPSLSDRLLQTLMPPPTLSQPMDLWRGCWASGTLATISNDASLPPVVVERARAQVELAIGQKATPELRFSEAARAWLDGQVPRMVASIEIDPATYDVWELWISAQRVLGRNEHYDQAIGRAIHEILATGTDLAQAGASVNVVGRLVTLLVEEANATSYQVARAWFESDKITSRDLWVFTTLLAMSDKSTWFPDRMVLPEDADQTHRWRIRDDLAGVWPSVDTSGAAESSVGSASLAFNRDLVSEWNDLCNQIAGETTESTPESQLRRLIRLSRLSEAAQAIENQDDDQARQVIRELRGTTSQAGGSSAAPAQPTKVGQPIGHDGEWAAAYAQIGRNFEQRIDSLRSLRSTAGTDLGPIDAELFVRELYRGSPPDVRLVAQSVATEQFTAGPVVAMELVDQLPGAPTTESLSQMIQDLTGESLPGLREANWPVMARLALVRHAMRVRSESTTSLDSLTDALIHSYVERVRLLRRERVATAAPATPQDAAELLVQAWADRSAIASAASPVPESLAGLQRRQTIRLRLAEGPIQIFAVYQLSILDRLAYVTVADQPALRDSVIDGMRQASSERLRVPGILDQIAHIELSVVRMWRIRFSAPERASTGDPRSAEES